MSSGSPTRRQSSSSFNRQQPTSNKLELPSSLPADLLRIVQNLVLFLCRRIIFAPTNFKILIYLLIVLVGSLLKDLSLAPTTYFTAKTNIFNVYFAKLGWGWSLAFLVPFVYLTAMIYTRGSQSLLVRHMLRLIVATGIWYVLTNLFIWIEAQTGMCKHSKGGPKMLCIKGGHAWQEGHDISGHTFLLIYALLVINEEVKAYDEGWKKLEIQVARNAKPATGGGGGGEASTTSALEQRRMQTFSLPIRGIYVALAALTVLWEFLLLSTALYFHHILHKFAAAALAILMWHLTYRVWFRQASASPRATMFQPCLPGHGLLSY